MCLSFVFIKIHELFAEETEKSLKKTTLQVSWKSIHLFFV